MQDYRTCVYLQVKVFSIPFLLVNNLSLPPTSALILTPKTSIYQKWLNQSVTATLKMHDIVIDPWLKQTHCNICRGRTKV